MFLDCIWNVTAHTQKPDFVFWRNGRVHLNWWGCQFSWLLAAEMCASVVVMLDRPCSGVVWEYQLPTPFASFPFTSPPMSPCAITFQLDSNIFQALTPLLTLFSCFILLCLVIPCPKLTLILLMWRIGWAPNNASKWQMRFNSAFKGLIHTKEQLSLFPLSYKTSFE
jgi:hypothetical protein